MNSPRSQLALKLLGACASEIETETQETCELRSRKRQQLREQFERTRETLSEQQIAEFVRYSKKNSEAFDLSLDLLDAERARNLAIVERDRARVHAAKNAMKKSINELIAAEISRKDLEKRKHAHTLAFAERLARLTDRRAKESRQREKARESKRQAREDEGE